MVIICKLVHKAKNSKRQMDERTDRQYCQTDGRTDELTNQPTNGPASIDFTEQSRRKSHTKDIDLI